MTETEIINKAMTLINKQADKIDEYDKALRQLQSDEWKQIPLGEKGSYGYKSDCFWLYLMDNPMIQDLITNLPDGITPDRLNLKRINMSVKPKSEYSEIYNDKMGISRDEIEPRSASLKRKDKELKHFTKIHKEFFVE